MDERRNDAARAAEDARETAAFADTNDDAVVTSPSAEPLYARQASTDHEETDLELEVALPLPDAPELLLDGLSRSVEDGGLLSYRLAESYGALEHCDRCGRPIIEVPTLAAALAEKYGVGDEQRLAFDDAMRRSTLEVGNDYAPNFCSYHGQITSE